MKTCEESGIGSAKGALQRGDLLILTTLSAVDPHSWIDNDGTIGWLKLGCGELTVTQTPYNQRIIARLLRIMADPNSPRDDMPTYGQTNPDATAPHGP